LLFLLQLCPSSSVLCSPQQQNATRVVQLLPPTHNLWTSTSWKPHTALQKVCEGLRVEGEEQAALQQQLEQQQAQLAAADEQHAAGLVQLAALRLTALDGTPDKLLEQVITNHMSAAASRSPGPNRHTAQAPALYCLGADWTWCRLVAMCGVPRCLEHWMCSLPDMSALLHSCTICIGSGGGRSPAECCDRCTATGEAAQTAAPSSHPACTGRVDKCRGASTSFTLHSPLCMCITLTVHQSS